MVYTNVLSGVRLRRTLDQHQEMETVTDFVTIVNNSFSERLIRKTVAKTVLVCYDNPQIEYINSALVFNGHLCDIKIYEGVFIVRIVEGCYCCTIFRENCKYSLVSFIRLTRKWLTLALSSDDYNPNKVAEKYNIKRFCCFKRRNFSALTMLQRDVVRNYALTIRCL